MAGKKCTKTEHDRRVLMTMQFLSEGYGPTQILHFTTQHEDVEKRKEQEKQGLLWNIKIDQVKNYISEANKILKDEFELDKIVERSKAKKRLEKWITESEKIQDFKTCTQIQKTIIDLFGLSEPVKLKVEQDISINDLRGANKKFKEDYE
jgi:hypothetical protein